MTARASGGRGMGLAFRTTVWSWAATLATLVLFVAAVIPQQKEALRENLASKALGVAVSLQNVVAGAVVSEDFSAVVDACTDLLQRDASVDFVVICKNDGFSLVNERSGWRADNLQGREWHPEVRRAASRLGVAPLFGRRAFLHARPFDYSGIQWGWIHVGLSLDAYDRSVATVHRQTGLLAVCCVVLGLVASAVNARRVVQPILGLRDVVRRVAGGDLSARAETGRTDELGTLADSVNGMAEALLRRDRILESVRFAAKEFLGSPEWGASLGRVLEKIGQAAEVKRAFVFERGGDTSGASNQDVVKGCWSWPAGGGPGGSEAWSRGLAVDFAGLASGKVFEGRIPDGAGGKRPPADEGGGWSTIIVPIHVGGEWWGGLGLADGANGRVWTDAERDSFRAAADMLGAAITRQRTQDALVEARDTLELRVLERTRELREQVVAKEKALAERRRAEATLMESEERFRSLFENATVGIYRISGDGRLLMANPALLQMLKFPSLEAAYRWDVARTGGTGATDRDRFLEWMARDGMVLGLESRWRCHDGSFIHVRESAKAVREPGGGLRWFEGTVEDITQRKLAEEELARLNQEVRETARQAGMAEVATGVLHNVGNVLNSVNVSASVVLDRLRQSKVASLPKLVDLLREHAGNLGDFLDNDARGRRVPGYLSALAENLQVEQDSSLEELESLRKHIDHIKDIVAMQQNYARVSGVVETVAASQLVEDALQLNAGALARHGVKVFKEFSEVSLIAVEKHKVLQILVNVIRNAKYALDDARTDDKQLKVCVDAPHPEQVRIRVIDNGVGISPENLTRIFQHGFTTRKEGHGFGLHSGALAARELGGSLTAYSEGLGAGATFTIDLPIRKPTTVLDRNPRSPSTT